MRVFVVGNGFLARELRHHSIHEVEILPDRLETLARSGIEPGACVVNAAAKTGVDWCETHPEEAVRVNAICAAEAARRVVSAGGRWIQISTGCLWDGPYNSAGEPFSFADSPSPASVYGWSKALADYLMPREVCILRPRLIYGVAPHKSNAIDKLRRYTGLIAAPGSMTSARTLARAIDRIVEGTLLGARWCVYDRGEMSPYRAGAILAEEGLRSRPQLLERARLEQHPRRVDAVMRDLAFETAVVPPDCADELRAVARLWAQAVPCCSAKGEAACR